MPTRNVVLTEQQEKLIDTLVKSGRYQNASEVLREGLRMVARRESEDAAKLDVLRAAAKLGSDAFERGAYEEFEDASALAEHLDRLAEGLMARASKK